MYIQCILLFIILVLFIMSIYRINQTQLNNGLTKYVDTTLVINLMETIEGRRRWDIIQNNYFFKNIVKRFPGVYGKTRDKSVYDNIVVNTTWDIGKWLNNKSRIIDMSDGEIGVSISHYNIWKYIVENNMGKVFILEDDAIDISYQFNRYLEIIFNEVPDNWDIILLGFWLHKGDTGYKVSKNIYRVKDFVLMHGYIINTKGASKLLQHLPIDAPLDTWISSISDDLYIYRHHFVTHVNKNQPYSIMINQKRKEKQIVNTNNWVDLS